MAFFIRLAHKSHEDAKIFSRDVLPLQEDSFKQDSTCLSKAISTKLNIPINTFDMIFMGKQLKAGVSLESAGVESGMTVFVLPKAPSEETKAFDQPSHDKMKYLVASLRLTFLNPEFRNMIQMLQNPEFMNKIFAAIPELAEDPVALAILQDTDLLVMLSRNDSSNVRKLVERHPVLARAALLIKDEYEAYSKDNGNPTPPPNISYYIDALSDDDEMDGSREQDLATATALAAAGLRPSMGPPAPITPSQLASALASFENEDGSSASSSRNRFSSSSLASPSQLQTPPSTPRTLITTEMFSSAVQQALGTIVLPQANNWQSQLQQLRDMGISDDSISQRALEATGGDVHAALELIFGDLNNTDEN